MDDKTLVERLRDEDSYYRIQEKHWCVDAEELERQRLAAADRIEALEAALRSVAKTCREEIPLPYVGKMREVLLRNLAEWCEQALESSDA